MSRNLIIVPTYNERDNVQELVEGILTTVPGADIMLVDDSSPDGTADLAERLFGNLPNFRVLRRSGPRGLGRSYVDAYRTALAGCWIRVIQMDADLSHDPHCIPALLEAACTADVVIGSRYCPGGSVRNWPLRRHVTSRLANTYVRNLLNLPVRDATSGYRCYTRCALEQVGLSRIQSRGFAFQVEMTYLAHRRGLRIVEVPIVFVDRHLGRSKADLSVVIEMLFLPWRLRLHALG